MQDKNQTAFMDKKFDAFISYSSKDHQFAEALEKELEKYKPPKGLGLPNRSLNIFRYEGDMTGHDLETAIRKHLDNSSNLIVICSPDARKSRYVNIEIDYFIKNLNNRKVLTVLSRGLPNKETENENEKAFPKALFAIYNNPLSSDYRDFTIGVSKIRRGLYKGEWYKLISNLFDKRRDEIEERDKKRSVRRRRISTVLILSLIFVLSTLTLFAFNERNKAENNAIKYQARSLANSAQLNINLEPMDALKTALEAYEMDPTSTLTQQALMRTYYEIEHYKRISTNYNITALAIAPDENYILSGGYGKYAHLWNMNGDIVQSFGGSYTHITDVDYSPCGDKVLVVSYHRGAQLYTKNGELIHSFEDFNEPLFAGVFSPDCNEILLGGISSGVVKYRINGDKDTSYDYSGNVQSVCYSRDGSFIAAGGWDGAKIWHAKSGELIDSCLQHVAGNPIRSVAISPDNKYLLTGGDDKTARLFLIGNGKVNDKGKRIGREILRHDNGLKSVAFSQSGDSIITTSWGNNVVIWEVGNFWDDVLEEYYMVKKIKNLYGHHNWVSTGIFSSDGRTIYTGSHDQSINIWDLKSNDPNIIADLGSTYYGVNPSPIESKILVLGAPVRILNSNISIDTIWDCTAIHGLFFRDGKRIVIACNDDDLVMINIDGELLYNFGRWKGEVNDIALSSDGKSLVAGTGRYYLKNENHVMHWDISSLELKKLENPVKENITSVGIQSHTGHVFYNHPQSNAGYVENSKMEIWNPRSNSLSSLNIKDKTNGIIKFSANGELLLTNTKTEGNLYPSGLIYNFTTEEVYHMNGHKKNINDASFDKEGRFIVTGSGNYDDQDNSVRLWNSKGKEIYVFDNLDDHVTSVGFSYDGNYIIGATKTKVYKWLTPHGIANKVSLNTNIVQY